MVENPRSLFDDTPLSADEFRRETQGTWPDARFPEERLPGTMSPEQARAAIERAGAFDSKWLESLPPLPERHWIACPMCGGVFCIFAPGIDPRRSPAMTTSCVVDRDGKPVFSDAHAGRLLEQTPCLDCGKPIGGYAQDIFGSSRWWRHGAEVPAKGGAR